MADSKITALTALTAADPVNDMFPIVDVSDTTMAASGTTKKISVNNILGASGTATLASATITGALGAAGLNVTGATIPANGVYLGSANNLSFSAASTLAMTLNSTGLGVGVASPSYAFQVKKTLSGTSTTVNPLLYLENNGGGNSAKITLTDGISNNGYIVYSNETGNALLGLGVGSAQQLVVNSSGNVGIGVTPTYKLDTQVAGGADRSILRAAVTGVSGGFNVNWNHATLKTRVIIENIPTSAAGLATGTLWNDAGTIKIA